MGGREVRGLVKSLGCRRWEVVRSREFVVLVVFYLFLDLVVFFFVLFSVGGGVGLFLRYRWVFLFVGFWLGLVKGRRAEGFGLLLGCELVVVVFFSES